MTVNLTDSANGNGPLLNPHPSKQGIENLCNPPGRALGPRPNTQTGAPSVDHWFGWQVGSTRDAFCGEVGLDPEQPYVLYVCSSGFVAPDIAEFHSSAGGVETYMRRTKTLIAGLCN